MPYYIYTLAGPLKLPQKQAVAATFKEAKAQVNALRRKIDPQSGIQARMVFADDELAAEALLTQPRELDPSLAGDDY